MGRLLSHLLRFWSYLITLHNQEQTSCSRSPVTVTVDKREKSIQSHNQSHQHRHLSHNTQSLLAFTMASNQSSSASYLSQESHHRLKDSTSCAFACNKDTSTGLSSDDNIQGLLDRVFLQPVRENRHPEKNQPRHTSSIDKANDHPVRIQRRCGITSLA